MPRNSANAILSASPRTPSAASSRISTTRNTTIVHLSYGGPLEGADAPDELPGVLQRKVMDALDPHGLGSRALLPKGLDALPLARVPVRIAAGREDRERRDAQPDVHRGRVLLPDRAQDPHVVRACEPWPDPAGGVDPHDRHHDVDHLRRDVNAVAEEPRDHRAELIGRHAGELGWRERLTRLGPRHEAVAHRPDSAVDQDDARDGGRLPSGDLERDHRAPRVT